MGLRTGSVIGIFGGGQLGRMTASAARTLGYRIHALDPDPHCPAHTVVDKLITGAFTDEAAAVRLAQGVDVVTLEIEKVGLSLLDRAAEHCPTRPSRSVLSIIQNRARQKRWLVEQGFPVGPFQHVETVEAMASALSALGGDSPCFIKAVAGGYDGRGQYEARTPDEAPTAVAALGTSDCVVEKTIKLERELSVMVARNPSGDIAVYPVAQNHHRNRILAWSVLPAPIGPALATEAASLAGRIAAAIAVEGVLTIELFVTKDGELLVNELAPRPHNSFHATSIACATSQFEQLVRAVCDLPLGSVDVLTPAAIVNVLGDLWLPDGATEQVTPDFEPALAVPGVTLHLYGKAQARRGRKMGHLLSVGTTAEQAVDTVIRAARAVGIDVGRAPPDGSS